MDPARRASSPADPHSDARRNAAIDQRCFPGLVNDNMARAIHVFPLATRLSGQIGEHDKVWGGHAAFPLANCLLTTALTVASTKAEEMRSPDRYLSP